MRIAAIDIGTNSLHMIVCQVRPDLSFEVIDREKDMVRLGSGSLDGRHLPEANISAAIHTLEKFLRIAHSHGVDEVVAAATSAVREAKNGSEFVAAVKRDVGLRVRVISGTEEARLIHRAAAYAVGVGKRTAIVIDIGGGSTEITAGTAERIHAGRSFRLGAIRLTERFAKEDPLPKHDERRLGRHIERAAGSYLRQLSRRHAPLVIGTSGTILSLGALAGDLKPSDDVRNVRVSAKALHRLRKRITAMTLEERLLLPNLDPRRADLAPAGAVLLDVLLKGLGATELTLCDFALREGLILDYIQRNAAHIRTVERYPDVRRRSVIELAERYNYYPAHAAQVARLALMVFDATKEKHGLGAREREWLEYGALLHDIGTHISYERHHRHSHYLISHGGLRGFEPEEIAVIGLIARYHRQALPRKSHEGFADLSRERRQAVRVLGALVRLAEGLDRSHVQVVTGLAFAPTDDALLVRVHGTGDADLEMWAADRHAAPLTDLLGIPLRFEFAGPLPAAAPKDAASHARHARNAAHVPGAPVRGRRHRRVGKNDTARPARKVAGRQRPPRVRD